MFVYVFNYLIIPVDYFVLLENQGLPKEVFRNNNNK